MKKIFITLIVLIQFSCVSTVPIDTELAKGSSFENAVVFSGVTNMFQGISLEKQWIRKNYPNAQIEMQASVPNGEKIYDVLTLKTSKGSRTVYFDVTGWYGKIQ